MSNKAVLVLADGKVFNGESFGAETASGQVAEVVFNTSMYGYQEIITDPSYAGQIMTFTTVEIGNVGVNSLDWESDKAHVSGVVCNNYNDEPSNYRAEGRLSDCLKTAGIPGISGVDTRALVQHLRDNGAQMGVIAAGNDLNIAELQSKAQAAGSMLGKDYVTSVTCDTAYTWNELPWDNQTNSYPKSEDGSLPLIVAIDLGIKRNILRLLAAEGYKIKVVPALTTAKEILSDNPAGVFISNGPGDPATQTDVIKNVKDLLGQVPVFGICLGHQILSQALGAKTFKLKFGHRGGNHPVLDCKTRCVEITAQNHGFAVNAEDFENQAYISHINLNDQTLEGIDAEELKAFSVQHHPEASPGPHDSKYLFSKFSKLVNNA